MSGAAAFTASQAVACGLLWGLIVTVVETLSFPVSAMSEPGIAIFVGMLFAVYLIGGMAWSAIALRLHAATPAAGVIAVLLLAPLLAILHVAIAQLQEALMPGDGIAAMLGPHSETALFWYAVWVNGFYGSLYVLGFAAAQRTLLLRALVARADAARAGTRAAAAGRRLVTVRGQLQPALLRDAISGIRTSYADNDPSADRRFDALITFLRAAMPGVRHATTTLQAELELVEAWLALDAASAARRAVRATLAPANDGIPFPALSLLPLVAAMSTAGQIDIEGVAGDDYRLSIEVPATALDGAAGALLGTLRLRLDAMHGSHAIRPATRGSDGGGDRLTINFTIPAVARRQLQGELGCYVA